MSMTKRWISSDMRSRSGPAISMAPFKGSPAASVAIKAATSSDATGWMYAGDRRTVWSRMAFTMIATRNS